MDQRESRWRREATALGVIMVVLALIVGVCAVLGDNAGVGPLP